MYCPRCGAELMPGSAFCMACGAPTSGAIPQSNDSSSSNRTRPAVIAVAVIALVSAALLTGLMCWALFSRMRKTSTESDRVPVVASLQIPGLDASGSRVPVRVKGTDSSGNPVAMSAYMGWDGQGLRLKPGGTYQITIAGSPIASDGRIYYINNEFINLEYDASSNTFKTAQPLALDPIDPADVTDEELAQAVAWVRGDPVCTNMADTLEEAVVEQRETALGEADFNQMRKKQQEKKEEENEEEKEARRQAAIEEAQAMGLAVYDGHVHVETVADYYLNVIGIEYPYEGDADRSLAIFNIGEQEISYDNGSNGYPVTMNHFGIGTDVGGRTSLGQWGFYADRDLTVAVRLRFDGGSPETTWLVLAVTEECYIITDDGELLEMTPFDS